MFFTENQALLSDFARMSQAAGSRADFVQGGGGNTSVKLPGGLMAVKASGFRLSDIRPDKAYAVLDYEALRRFYFENEPETLGDVEKEGAACARENVKQIEGLDALRPSVEAGFHAILGTFVLHTHSVYANLAACSAACREIAALAFSGEGYRWGWVDYTDPGARLTFAITMDARGIPEGRAVASTKTGELVMNMPLRQAQALSETLTAVFFVMEHIKAAGYPLSTMGEAAKNFIANWESEKYRKALAGKDGCQ